MSTSPPLIVADRYRLVAPLGQGGMGRVWRATDVVLHRDVAIKELVPPPGLTTEERQEMRERSLREARAIARLNNIHVVRIFDVLRTDADPWIVMEYVPSRSLQDILAADGPYPPPRAAEIGLGVLGALRAAHRAGVVHRDVKPGNVLIGEDGRVVLTDFGLATVPGDPNVTRTGLVLGSPAYIAPERARDGSAGPGADLWSLGATLYAAVEGASPFARPSAIATLAALATENPPPARNAGPLKAVLNGLLRKDPAHRINAEEAERLLLRAAGRRSRISFPMNPTMRRPGLGRDRPSAPVAPPVVPGPSTSPSTSSASSSGPSTAAGSAPVVPGPRPPVSPARPPVVAGGSPPVYAPGKATVGRPTAPPPVAPAANPPADAPTRADTPAAGRAAKGAVPLDATRVDTPVIDPSRAPLDATRVDTPAVSAADTRTRGRARSAPVRTPQSLATPASPGPVAPGSSATAGPTDDAVEPSPARDRSTVGSGTATEAAPADADAATDHDAGAAAEHTDIAAEHAADTAVETGPAGTEGHAADAAPMTDADASAVEPVSPGVNRAPAVGAKPIRNKIKGKGGRSKAGAQPPGRAAGRTDRPSTSRTGAVTDAPPPSDAKPPSTAVPSTAVVGASGGQQVVSAVTPADEGTAASARTADAEQPTVAGGTADVARGAAVHTDDAAAAHAAAAGESNDASSADPVTASAPGEAGTAVTASAPGETGTALPEAERAGALTSAGSPTSTGSPTSGAPAGPISAAATSTSGATVGAGASSGPSGSGRRAAAPRAGGRAGGVSTSGVAPFSGAPVGSTRPPWQPMPVRAPSTGRAGLTIFGVTLDRRQTYILLAVVVAVLLVLAFVVPKAFGDEKSDRGAAGGPGTATSTAPTAPSSQAALAPAPSGAVSTAPSAAASSSAASRNPAASPTSKAPAGGGFNLPAGWEMHKDSSGFSVPVPRGWSAQSDGSELYFRERGGSRRVLIVDQTDSPKSDPAADWTDQERRRRGGYDDYNGIRIASVSYRGFKAADWEFTYTSANGNEVHTVKRGFVTAPDQAYGISWITPADRWDENLDDLKIIFDGFQPARR